MKIEDVKTYVVGNPPPHHGGINWIFLKLTTEEGIEGVGEAYGIPFHPDVTTRIIEDVGERFVVGSDSFQIENMWRKIYTGHYGVKTPYRPGVTSLAVISAFEMACLDIIGKETNQPIYNLLGGKVHDKLRSYTYIYPDSDSEEPGSIFTDPELAPKRAKEYVEQGFTALKFDPIEPIHPTSPQQITLEDLSRAEAVVRNVRAAVGDKCDILIGTHGQMTTSSAIRFAQRIEEYDPLWFEEPVPPENKDEMALVARSTSIPIATGESLATKYEFRELLEDQAATILQMAMARVGGILEGKKIAGMAESHYAHIAPHLYTGPIEAAANIQLDVCSPNFLIQESIETFDGFHGELLKEPIEWKNGYIIPPEKPGLGVELDEEVIEENPQIEVKD